jgi:hypothetical protein
MRQSKYKGLRMRAIFKAGKLSGILIGILLFAGASMAKDICGQRKPEVPGFKVVHGIIKSQFQIDPDGGGPRIGRGSRLIEIERLWGLGGKSIFMESLVPGRLHAVQMDLYLKSETIRGVFFWKLALMEGSLEVQNLMPEQSSETSVERGDRDEWKTLNLPLSKEVNVGQNTHLDFNARTIFKKPLDPKNILQGTRVDACVYFLIDENSIDQGSSVY